MDLKDKVRATLNSVQWLHRSRVVARMVIFVDTRVDSKNTDLIGVAYMYKFCQVSFGVFGKIEKVNVGRTTNNDSLVNSICTSYVTPRPSYLWQSSWKPEGLYVQLLPELVNLDGKMFFSL